MRQSMKTTIAIIILTILLATTAAADGEQYLFPGVTRDSTYQQDGSGYWEGRSPVTLQRAGNYTAMPVIADVDNDGQNEIITTRAGRYLQVLNYSSNTSITLEAEQDLLNTTYGVAGAGTFTQTPAVYDYDGDGYLEIITITSVNASIYQWNGSAITLENTTGMANLTCGSGNLIAQYPIIKCAPETSWATGHQTCAFPIRNSGPSLCMAFYDLTMNRVNMSCVAIANADAGRWNTHLTDYDNDGYLEFLYKRDDLANDDMYVYKAEIINITNTSMAALYSDLKSGTASEYTDIIVNNLDSTLTNGLETTWGYTDDGTNWQAKTVRADGTVIEDDYCTVLTCPEGDRPSLNLFEASDTTYSDYSGDVCYYIRSYDGSDQVLCLSQYAGSAYTKTTITNTANTTNPIMLHEAALLNGTTGILLNEYIISGTSKQTNPQLMQNAWTIPVDYRQAGGLDIIGGNGTTLVYYSAAYTNRNYAITALNWDTGNPICYGEILTLTPTLEDPEADPGNCILTERNPNTTFKANHSETTVNPFYTNPQLFYTADEQGTFYLDTLCRDQYHTDYANRTYTVQVSNLTCGSTGCYCKGAAPAGTTYETNETTAADDEFTDKIETTFANMGVSSKKAKAIVWLVIMAIVGFGVMMAFTRAGLEGTNSLYGLIFIEFFMVLVGWYFGFIGTIVLVIIGLFLAFFITVAVMNRLASPG